MRLTISAIVLALLPATWAIALNTTTVSFQNGVGGYNSTFDRYIFQVPGGGVDGSAIQDFILLGVNQNSVTPSGQQGLIRFDNIFGTNPGQIPLGARIVEASLQLSTIGGPSTSTDDSNGPYTPAGLLQPFNNTTVWSTYTGGNGALFASGDTTRPQGAFGRLDHGETQQQDIRSIVQQWSDQTLANNGLAVTGGYLGPLDDWRILTTGNPSPGSRPKLSVTYTMDNVQVSSFQRGANGYTNVESARVSSACNTTGTSCTGGAAAPATTPGDNIGSMTLQLATANSTEQFALFRFNDVFGSNAGQAPADKPVARAWLVLTTLSSAIGTNQEARIPAPVDAYEVKQNWTTSTLFTGFGANIGLQSGDGDITQETLYRTPAAAVDGEIWFDVTNAYERIRNGATNNGIAIQARSTDGWQFVMNGTTNFDARRPRLVVMSDLSAAAASPGDFNNSGQVDAADYVIWRKNETANVALPNDNGVGNQAARYALFRSNFGNMATAASPQPTTVLKYDASPKNGVLTGAINNGTVALVNLPAAPTPTGVTGLDMTRGAGIAGAGLTNGYSSSGYTNGGDRAAAIANNDYYEFGLTLDATHTASLSKLDLTLRRGETASADNYEIQASLDNFATAPIILSTNTYMGRADGDPPIPDPSLDTPFYYMTNDQPGRPNTTFSPTDPIPTVDLSTFPALQNIAASSTVKFRLYAWGADSDTATFGFRVTGPKITGIVSSLSGLGTANIPEPSCFMLAAVLGTLLVARRPVRKCMY